MNDHHTLTVIRDHLAQARDSIGEEHPSIPAREIITRARRRRTRRWLASAGATCAVAGLAVALALPSGSQLRPVHVHLAAWSVDTNSNGTVTVTVRQLTHAAELQRALADADVPAIVTWRDECLNTQNQDALAKAGVKLKRSVNPPGEIITPSQIPAGTKLLFSLIPVTNGDGTRGVGFGWGLVKTGEPLHCFRVKSAHVYPKAAAS